MGPVWDGGDNNESELLARCYRRSLEIAQFQGINSIAFPAISCGVYRYPVEQATKIAVQAIADFLTTHDLPEQVYLVCFESKIRKAYEQHLLRLEASESKSVDEQ